MSEPSRAPSPERIFDSINAYTQSAAIKSAIELEVFTAIAEGLTTPAALAPRCGASERGLRTLCDFLVVHGHLTKADGAYGLTQDSAVFLNKKSPAYVGSAVEFLLHPMLTDPFKDMTNAVRKGRTTTPQDGTMAPDYPLWVDFARAMAPMVRPIAQKMTEALAPKGKIKVLDIAAGHGLFGVTIGAANPDAEIVAQDWKEVVAVAQENAQKAGLGSRFRTLPGSAFDVDYGTGYDLVLLTNFLHHFDIPTCEKLLRKVHAALKPGGRAATIEFVPNDDRVTPPTPAAFSLMMLAGTPGGDAYTFKELEAMFRATGFARSEMQRLPPTFSTLVISHR